MNNGEKGERRETSPDDLVYQGAREVMEIVYSLIGDSDSLKQLRNRATRGDARALDIVARVGIIRADVLEVIKVASGEKPRDEFEKERSDFIEEILRNPEVNGWKVLTPEQAARFDELNFRVHVNPRLLFNPDAPEASTAYFWFPDGRRFAYRELREGVYGFIDRS